MKQKIYICSMQAINGDVSKFPNLRVSVSWKAIIAYNQDEAIGSALRQSQVIWPTEEWYNHHVQAEEIDEEFIDEMYRLYPLEIKKYEQP